MTKARPASEARLQLCDQCHHGRAAHGGPKGCCGAKGRYWSTAGHLVGNKSNDVRYCGCANWEGLGNEIRGATLSDEALDLLQRSAE